MHKVATFIDEQSLRVLRCQLAEMGQFSGREFLVENQSQPDQLLEIFDFNFFVLDPALLRGETAAMLARLRQLRPTARVLIYSDKNDYKTVTSLLKAGVSGYILKDCPVFGLAHALEAASLGGVPLSPQISRQLLQGFLTNSVAHSLTILTKREKQIFACLEEGNSYKGISSRFNISQNTVHSHVKNIYSKLNAVNKYDAFVKARDLAAA